MIGRVHGELILIKTDRGVTRSFRVRPEVGAKLDLGQRASVSFDAAGRPTAVWRSTAHGAGQIVDD